MAKNIFKLFLLVFSLTLVLMLASCEELLSEFFPKEEPEDMIYNMSTVYAQAQALGYDGSLEEFVALVSGKDGKDGKDGTDGLGIKSSFIDNDCHLILTLTDGTIIDAGKLPQCNCADDDATIGVYTVTFDYGNGVVETRTTENYKIAEPNAPSRDGYYFVGWTADILEDYLWLFPAYAITEDMTFTANWTPIIYEYEIYLDNGTFVDWGYLTIESIDASAPPERIGYTFIGWTWEGQTTPVENISLDNFTGDILMLTANYRENTITPNPDDSANDGWWNDITYDETSLIFQMTNCSNNQELSSGCERYLAGTSEDNCDIDSLVEERNTYAYYYTNVNVTYYYYPDIASLYGFSKTIDVIFSEITSGSPNTPDIFCSFMTDLAIASLKGCFANLYSTQYGDNYFDFSANGYMPDLMGSLSLSQNKIYVLASDYFIDIVRAFYVIPVNLALFNSIAVNTITDLNYDGCLDILDLYELVYNGDWTYDQLVTFCEAIYQPAATNVGGTSINDVLGFGLASNGLPAAGLVYSSSVSIINKTWSEGQGKFIYTYPNDNPELYALYNAIADLVNSHGVMYVTKSDAAIIGEDSPLLGVRHKFATNEMLFGGIVLAGSLEYLDYQDMKTREGFGLVPVPVYQEGDNYLTQVHVTGRAGAISRTTTKFSQCSAFLQYQSTNSELILNEYYDFNLSQAATSSPDSYVNANVEMLQYIHSNVRTSLDKFIEDAISYMCDPDIEYAANSYHALLVSYGYSYKNIRDHYAAYVAIKQSALQFLIMEYDLLPG